jgi:hypothetical protein
MPSCLIVVENLPAPLDRPPLDRRGWQEARKPAVRAALRR